MIDRILKLVLSLAGIFLLVMSLLALYKSNMKSSPVKVASKPDPVVPKTDPFASLTSAQRLAEAKKALDEWKPNKNPMNTSWGRVSDAREHLMAIPKGAKETSVAARLLKEVERREKEIAKLTEAGARKIVIGVREKYAEVLEISYLKKGMDVKIELQGPGKETIKMTYVLYTSLRARRTR